MIRRFRALLRSPYPYEPSAGSALLYGAACGLFVFAFFYVFEPFGFNLVAAAQRRLIFAGYALVTCLAIVANDRLLPRLFPRGFREAEWSLGRQILFMSWVTLVIALGCYGFTIWMFRDLGLLAPPLPRIVLFTFLIAVFPITVINLVNYLRLLRGNERVVREANRHLENPAPESRSRGPEAASYVELIAENDRDSLRLACSDLLYIKAEENYVQVHHKGGKPGRVLLRSSLTRIERQLRPHAPRFFRCHRAHIVNTAQIVKVDGNAQGLRLSLRDTPDTVPVARRYVAEFRRLVQGL